MIAAQHNTRIRSGFTLVELSIVLVIIGLLVGGVLVGKDMIQSALLRQQLRQFERLKQAHLAFILKYNCIPGDCRTATRYFSGVSNGNGDSQVAVPYNWVNSTSFTGEIRQYWMHLSKAELYELTPTGTTAIKGVDFPKNARNSGGMVMLYTYPETTTVIYAYPYYGTMAKGHTLWLNIANNDISSGVIQSNSARMWLSREVADMDTKIDDGNGVSGDLYAPLSWLNSGSGAFGNLTTGTPVTNTTCRNNTTGVYINQSYDGGENLGDGQVNHAYPCWIVYRIAE